MNVADQQMRAASSIASVDWLLESDPAIRWQVMRDLSDTPRETAAAERARVTTEGWGAFLLARLRPGGDERQESREHRDWVTLETLLLLRAFGMDPASSQAREAVGQVREEVTWQGLLPQDSEWHGNPFFAGEVEPCINGRALAVGAYFGQNVRRIAERLLTEQMADGGWNCEDDNGATVGSFHSTINVLEGLLDYERGNGGSPEVTSARLRGEEYLIERGMFRRKSTGEVADPTFTQFAFPNGYHYDVLRGLDYLRAAEAELDNRLNEALGLVETKRDAAGRWHRDIVHPNHLNFEMDGDAGTASRWITLRAMRVLRWAGRW
jgi:hypothetical protein